MRRTPSSQHVQRLARVRVCARCPYRTPGTDSRDSDVSRPCESACPLFIRLPVLREAARQLDPMVGHRKRVLGRLVGRIAAGQGDRAGTLRRNGHRVVELLEKLFG